MKMKVHLPNSAFLGNLDPFLQSIDPSSPDNLEVSANKKWISIHPVVLSVVAALGLSIKNKSKIRFEEFEAKSKHYIERMGLFKLLGIKSNISLTEHEPAGRFIPLTIISNSAELTKFITEMVPLLHLSPHKASAIKHVISELVRNVFEHSGSKVGAVVCAQYYHKSNSIKIGVVDRGVGIMRSIQDSYAVSTDKEAIKLALTPGVTGTTTRIGGTDVNAGAGLFIIKSIAKVSRTFFVIYSGNCLYKLLKTPPGHSIRIVPGPFKDKCSVRDDMPNWQGAVVGIDISLDEQYDFVNLLEQIRKAFKKSIKERKGEAYKRRARFI